ncbi:alcohol dehydrogenase catalytic domain-containing protein [Catenuloplanes atrovinosus]|uniref:NADPH:quinone reductase-like Zn-dependent oxidoreductase n=1 Tax=Catenuloplanes atrovinosus TaxID=137266 RepID=A0AAE3YQ88_9ACTN|nr:zinc-binding dehydrogenase [Catenuloplanes atrovinosus]MDR7276616.1 NADPH:quinone reductase-like Zn-dependent oxidoreductase [Catenuloplanes atrovinosus]
MSVPEPGPGQILIKVEAAGVAFNDISTRAGLNPGPLPDVLGFDVVGHVEKVGAGVEDVAVGQRVGALVGTGGYATHALATSRRTARLPEGHPAEELDALVLNYLTAWQMFHRIAQPAPGQAVLVIGAAGGVGSALCQIASAAGVEVYGTSSRARRARVEANGATWVAGAEDVPVPVAATFDPVGGPSLARSRRATKRSGVVVSYGFSFTVGAGYSKAGAMARTVLALLRAKLSPGARVVVHMVERRVDKDLAGFRADMTALVEQLRTGALKPEVTTLPLDRAADAHRRLENREVDGKLVLIP